MRLWNLPGARRFVDRACDTLRGGSSLVISFPGAVPEGFDDTLAAELGNAFQIGNLSATASPLEDLCRQYADDRSQIQSISDLCEDLGFRGRLICLDNINEHNWPEWKAFLDRYAQTSRSLHVLGRSLFLVMLTGCPPAELPTSDVALGAHTWDGVLDDVDLLLFASERLRQRSMDNLLRSLLATVIARVAAWDFDTANALLGENDRTIMNPTELLRSIGRDNGWSTDTPLDWRLGTESGSGIAHPARAALEEPPNEINKRMWSAQLSVLLPWIETRRHELVAANLYEVKRQMAQIGKDLTDPHDLELGELSMMFSQPSADRRLRRRIRSLRDVRNRLAHRRHLSPDGVFNLLAREKEQQVA